MSSIHLVIVLAAFGLLHVTNSQTSFGLGSLVPQNLPAGSNVKGDVTATVMALLNETGYSGKASDANVQEIVAMLMNGTVPTDADLVRLGIISQRSTTAQPSYAISGNPSGLDPSLTLPAFVLPSGSQAGPSGGAQSGGPSSGNFLGGSALGSLTSGPTGTQTGGGLGTMDLFAAAALGTSGATGATPKPILGDPFSLNAVSGAGEALPGLAALDPNALGPKPFASLDPIGGLGTPGPAANMLGSLGLGGGAGGLGMGPQPLQTGILDTTMNQQNQRSGMSNPMMMMMMMNPELMEGMMAENPMMMYMMMQQMRPRRRPQPSLSAATSLDMGAFAGLGGATGAAGMMPSFPGPSSGGAGGSGLMDLMASMGTMGAGQSATSGFPIGLAPAPGGGTAPGGSADMSALLNMVNPGLQAPLPGSGPSATLMTDPFLATSG